MTELDPVLARQLKRLGLCEETAPPDAAAWAKFLGAVGDQYRRMGDDRALLTRSLELSTKEMTQLQNANAAERDRLREVVSAISNALAIFHEVAQSRTSLERTSGTSATSMITNVKQRFAGRLAAIFADSPHARDDAQDSVVDEIRRNFLYLADQLVQMLFDTADRAQLKKQLEVARAVRQMLVPPEDVIVRPGVRLAAYFQPATECSGDWWTAHDLDDGKVLTVIGDVTGHGVSSAIITGVAKAACDLARTFASSKLTVGGLLEMMNCSIYEAGRQKFLMTCVASIFDPKERTLTIANAGHPLPLLLRQGVVRQLVVHGSPLGTAATTEYHASTVPIAPGDALLWYTDGLSECENALREPFSEKRLRAAFLASATHGAEATRAAIVRALSEFRGDKTLDDDVTFVVASVS